VLIEFLDRVCRDSSGLLLDIRIVSTADRGDASFGSRMEQVLFSVVSTADNSSFPDFDSNLEIEYCNVSTADSWSADF